MLLLIFFIFLLILFRKNISVFSLLLSIQIISLTALLLVNINVEVNSIKRFANILYTLIMLTILMYPWRKYNKIQEIYCINENKVNKLSKSLLIISALTFIILSITSTVVILFVEDINMFKYSEGQSTEFFYTQLPIDVRWYMLASFIYVLSYFLIPLHFYYVIKLNKKYAFFCLLFSLNIILFGLTFFSRWTIIHYILIFGVFLFLFRDSVPKKYLKLISSISLFFIMLFALWFINITINRFNNNSLYEANIPLNSPIQNPSLYSNLDYLSQWYSNSLNVLDRYNNKSMMGQGSFSPLLSYLNYFTPIDWNADSFIKLRQNLLGDPYYYLFNGLVADMIYDFGYIISFILAIIYFYLVNIAAPKKKTISLTKLLLIVLSIQIPLFSIFYNYFSGIIIAILFWIAISCYLCNFKFGKINLKNKQKLN